MSEKNHAVVKMPDPQQLPERLHPMVRTMMASNPDPQTLRELMDLQREWEAGEAKRAYTRSLVELKAELPSTLARDKLVDFTNRSGVQTKYTHTSLASAMDTVNPMLTKHGFTINWIPGTDDKTKVVRVTCRMTHSGGHFEECSISAPVDTSGSKSPAQGVASTITLLQRYTALSLLGIATADMGEPKGATDDADPNEHIDPDRNMRAAASLGKYGRTREDAEAFLERSVEQWTAGDIGRLRQWLKDQPERTPGEEG